MTKLLKRSGARQLQQAAIHILLVVLMEYCPATLFALAAPLHLSAQSSGRLSFMLQQPALFQNGLIALERHDPEAALSDFTNAEIEQPNSASIRSFRGVALAQLGRRVEAEAEYQEAIRIDPQFEAAYRNLGFLEWSDHRLQAARLMLQHALSLAADDNFTRYYLGRVELEVEEYAAGFRDIHQSGIALPEDIDVQILAARGHSALGDTSQAKSLAILLTHRSLTALQTSDLAMLLVTLQEHDAAILLLQHWLAGHQGESIEWARLDVCLAYLVAGSYERAAAQAQRLTEPENRLPSVPAQAADAWSALGIAQARLRLSDQAIDAFRRAAELDPASEDHWLNLTLELMELGHFADTIASAEKAVTTQPGSYALRLRLGAAYLAMDRFDAAEKVFRTLIEAGDPLPTSSVGLAQVLLRTGRADQAIVELASARQRLGPSFLLSYFEGLADNRAARPVDAASAFREALRANPESAEAHAELGKTELKLMHFDEAILELQRALQLNPRDQQAPNLLKQAYRRSGVTSIVQKLSEAMPDVAATDAGGDFILPKWQGPGS